MRQCGIELEIDGQKAVMHYTDWGDEHASDVLFCVHGLTRNGRDFDILAQSLCTERRVICPDILGRGQSDWLDDKSRYQPEEYVAHCTQLIDRLGIAKLDWLGTSMGGIIGMYLAARDDHPIRHLVLNDIGPFIPHQALEYIADYVGQMPRFDDLAGLEAYLRKIHAGFGDLSDAQWRAMAEHAARRQPDGSLTLAYDPGIAEPFKDAYGEDQEFWDVYERITCPTLLLRGGDSPLLHAETAQAMTERGPKAELETFAGVGHAPALMEEAQIAVVRRFLAR
ncbi:MAG: alpha/beta fold hydrolase [Geminicoccaceae bacterium]